MSDARHAQVRQGRVVHDGKHVAGDAMFCLKSTERQPSNKLLLTIYELLILWKADMR